MKAYIDTSAFVKTFITERETPALKAFLDDESSDLRLASCHLLETEARRAARIAGRPQEVVTSALAAVALTDVPRSIFTHAGMIAGETLRSLDAIHLATALRHNVDVLIAYDVRLVESAAAHGIPTASPS